MVEMIAQFAWWEILGFVVVGLVSGVAAGFFGIGGGTIIVPCMLWLGFPIQHAIGISIVQMMFASVFGSAINYKKGLLDLREGAFIGLGGMMGASFSGVVLSLCSELVLSVAFLTLTIVSFYRFAARSKVGTSENPIRQGWQKRMILVLAGAFTGVFAISLGIGGGLLIAPILGYYLGYDSKRVVPLSLFFVVFSSVAGSFSLYHMEVIDSRLFSAAVLIGCCSIIGVASGIALIARASANTHRIALLCVYCFAIVMTGANIAGKALG